jgi:hypothetical protein
MVPDDVTRCLEPVLRHLVEYLPLEGDGAEDDIERTDPVGRYQDATPVVGDVAVADLTFVLGPELQVGAIQSLGQLPLEDAVHDEPPTRLKRAPSRTVS